MGMFDVVEAPHERRPGMSRSAVPRLGAVLPDARAAAASCSGAAPGSWWPIRCARSTTARRPVEKLTFERPILDGDGIHLLVRAGGSEPMTIAQVQVDDAYWTFTQDPPGDLARLSTAWLHVPFPWVLGEAHVVKVLTRTGTTFDHEIDGGGADAPEAHASQLVPQALSGPVRRHRAGGLGLMFYPALRGVGRAGHELPARAHHRAAAVPLRRHARGGARAGAEAAAAFQGPRHGLAGRRA